MLCCLFWRIKMNIIFRCMYKTVSLSQLQVLYRSIQHIGGGVSSASGTNQRRVGERCRLFLSGVGVRVRSFTPPPTANKTCVARFPISGLKRAHINAPPRDQRRSRRAPYDPTPNGTDGGETLGGPLLKLEWDERDTRGDRARSGIPPNLPVKVKGQMRSATVNKM